MKILIVTGIYPPAIGGSATYSALLKRELPLRGFETRILTYGNNGRVRHSERSEESREESCRDSSPREAGFRMTGGGIVRVSNSWPKGFRHIIFLGKLLFLARKHDLVLAADSSFGAATMAAIACRLLGKKFIVRVTGDYAWEQGVQRFGIKDLIDEFQKNKYGIAVQLLRYFQKFAITNATVVIAPSEYLRRLAIGWGADPDKVRVINNAVDLPHLNPPPQREGGNQPSFPPSSAEGGGVGGGLSFIIISAGRLVPWKGFEILIEAVSELQQEIPEIKLVIVGSGPEESHLKAISYKLKSDAEFTGAISKDELVKRIKYSRVFLLNTAYEGFSHQIVEAMSLGVPVVTTNVGGNPEIIKDGETGLLVGYNDKEAIKSAILRLYKDRALAVRIAAAGATSAKQYSVEVMLASLTNVL